MLSSSKTKLQLVYNVTNPNNLCFLKVFIRALNFFLLSFFRTKASLMNFPEFAAAFKCRLGSPMNPIKKCAVW